MVSYSVVFNFTAEYKGDLTREEVDSNTSSANNYIRLVSEDIGGSEMDRPKKMFTFGSNTGKWQPKEQWLMHHTIEIHRWEQVPL